ncbi:MAG: helix-turn-helix domain-containing protein [Nanoarchaeota archaeon]|nr:helix-turn-helix domain-containing protein [Nanoarchaeota archaeon]MBU1321683.1 helix-turn-helix domain-containing protein [Nanoarchaeota archaeon]MBU1598076.1 helix-turn-helix domain-containing protein [Nanoarchaeota archaeon]MBU2441632.1 helix-turn-helix domain-containing protein [Nanoarchaeota archaeon]
MYVNKSTAKILQFFAGHITESFTLREAARRLKMHVSLAHRAIQPLIRFKIIEQDKHKNLKLNYKTYHETLAFAEYLRRDNFLDKFKGIKFFADEVISKIKQDCFVLLVFGSAVESARPRDIDILLIVDATDKIEFHEKFLHNITLNYDLPFEERVIGFESVYEMLSKRDEKNVMNEILNKHIILYGAELFYRLLGRGR